MNVRTFINGKLVQGLSSELKAPPTPQKSRQSMPLQLTPEKGIPTPARTKDALQASDHKEKPLLDALVVSQRFIAISLPNCPQCDELAAALAARDVPVSSVFVKWDKGSPEYPSLKAALAVHAGDHFSFPQVFCDGLYQGGYEQVLEKLKKGVFDAMLEETFGATPMTVQGWIDSQPMMVFSLPQCPQCDELRSMLESQGLPTEKIFMKWDKTLPEYTSLKAQLVKRIGKSQFTFPQTFVKSEYQGSFDEVAAKLKAGQYDDIFAEAFGVAPPDAKVSASCAQIAFDEDF